MQIAAFFETPRRSKDALIGLGRNRLDLMRRKLDEEKAWSAKEVEERCKEREQTQKLEIERLNILLSAFRKSNE